MQSESRSVKWDNLKFVLIFFVVFGHILFPFRNESHLVRGFYMFIYSFHMPLFIFVSGLFSKTIIRKRQWHRVFSYLVLYVFIRTLDTLGTYMQRGILRLNYFKTNGPDWYALAVFLFLVVTIMMQNCNPGILILLSVVIGLTAGLGDNLGSIFASMRSCVFYPFFLLGFYADRKRLERFRGRKVRIAAGIVLALIICFFVIKGSDYFELVNLLKGKKTYEALHLTALEGVLLRGLQYLAALIISALMILAVPSAKNIFTGIGKKTLPIFAWHYLFIKVFLAVSGKKAVLKLFPETYILILLCLCMALIFFCSSRIFERTKAIMV